MEALYAFCWFDTIDDLPLHWRFVYFYMQIFIYNKVPRRCSHVFNVEFPRNRNLFSKNCINQFFPVTRTASQKNIPRHEQQWIASHMFGFSFYLASHLDETNFIKSTVNVITLFNRMTQIDLILFNTGASYWNR